MTRTRTTPGRNALCPCGSGKKYKKCCEGHIPKDVSSWIHNPHVLIVAGVLGILLGAAVMAGVLSGGSPPEPAGTTAPAAWEYDEENDRYWDPRPGHQHWHFGPPPPEHR